MIKATSLNKLNEGADGAELPTVQWRKPELSEEIGELERTAEQLGIDQNSLISAYKKAELQDLNDSDWENMKNCDSSDPTWKLEEVKEHLGGKRDFNIIEKGLKNGELLPAPVVLYQEKESPYLIGGNSRLLGCRALGIRPKILEVRIENEGGKLQEMAEVDDMTQKDLAEIKQIKKGLGI